MNRRAKSEDPVGLLSDEIGWVCSSGYEWVEGRAAPNGTGDFFLRARSEGGCVRPFAPDAYLDFSKIGSSGDSMLSFANRHGSLGISAPHFHLANNTAFFGERMSGWVSAVNEYHTAFELWSAVKTEDTKLLGVLLEPSALSAEDTKLFPALAERYIAQSARRKPAVKQPPLSARAMQRVVNAVNLNVGARGMKIGMPLKGCYVRDCKFANLSVAVPGTVSYELECSTRQGRVRVEPRIRPATLKAAIWLQFSELISGLRIVRQCDVCGQLMDISETARPRSKRMHDRCSLAERMRRYRAKCRS